MAPLVKPAASATSSSVTRSKPRSAKSGRPASISRVRVSTLRRSRTIPMRIKDTLSYRFGQSRAHQPYKRYSWVSILPLSKGPSIATVQLVPPCGRLSASAGLLLRPHSWATAMLTVRMRPTEIATDGAADLCEGSTVPEVARQRANDFVIGGVGLGQQERDDREHAPVIQTSHSKASAVGATVDQQAQGDLSYALARDCVRRRTG